MLFLFFLNKSPNFHKKKQGQYTMKSYMCLSWVWALRPRSSCRDFLKRNLEEVICMWQVQGCWPQGTQVFLVPGASKTSYLVSWISPAGAAGGRKERQDIWFPRDRMLSRNAIWRNKIDFVTFFSPEISKRSESELLLTCDKKIQDIWYEVSLDETKLHSPYSTINQMPDSHFSCKPRTSYFGATKSQVPITHSNSGLAGYFLLVVLHIFQDLDNVFVAIFYGFCLAIFSIIYQLL